MTSAAAQSPQLGPPLQAAARLAGQRPYWAPDPPGPRALASPAWEGGVGGPGLQAAMGPGETPSWTGFQSQAGILRAEDPWELALASPAQVTAQPPESLLGRSRGGKEPLCAALSMTKTQAWASGAAQSRELSRWSHTWRQNKLEPRPATPMGTLQASNWGEDSPPR